jgi:hypothetical protein
MCKTKDRKEWRARDGPGFGQETSHLTLVFFFFFSFRNSFYYSLFINKYIFLNISKSSQ